MAGARGEGGFVPATSKRKNCRGLPGTTGLVESKLPDASKGWTATLVQFEAAAATLVFTSTWYVPLWGPLVPRRTMPSGSRRLRVITGKGATGFELPVGVTSAQVVPTRTSSTQN